MTLIKYIIIIYSDKSYMKGDHSNYFWWTLDYLRSHILKFLWDAIKTNSWECHCFYFWRIKYPVAFKAMKNCIVEWAVEILGTLILYLIWIRFFDIGLTDYKKCSVEICYSTTISICGFASCFALLSQANSCFWRPTMIVFWTQTKTSWLL